MTGTKLQRADRLKEPPVVGRWYLVPAILWCRRSTSGSNEAEILRELQRAKGAKWWPVWGNKHNDIEYFNFAPLHYHLDPRFMTKRHWSEFTWLTSVSALQYVQGSPLNHVDLKSGPPKPTLRRMRCTMAHSTWGHEDSKPVVDLNRSFAGIHCAKGKRGWVCPHKRFPLGPVAAIGGVVTCPLHGLRVDAETGRCIGAVTESQMGNAA